MLKIALLAGTVLTSPVALLMRPDSPDTSTWVRFSSFAYHGKNATTPKAGEYLNPIVAGFYPDPSICRVGDDYSPPRQLRLQLFPPASRSGTPERPRELDADRQRH